MYPNNAKMINKRMTITNTFMLIFNIHFKIAKMIINAIANIRSSIIIFSPDHEKTIKGQFRLL